MSDPEHDIYRLAGEIKAYFESWQANHLEYKGDIAECMTRFNGIDAKLIRISEYQQRISDAMTQSAIYTNRLEQTVAMLSDIVDKHETKIESLDMRVTKIETSRAENLARAGVIVTVGAAAFTALGTVAGAVIAYFWPQFLSWFKEHSQ